MKGLNGERRREVLMGDFEGKREVIEVVIEGKGEMI